MRGLARTALVGIALLGFPATSLAATQTIGQTGNGGSLISGAPHDIVQNQTAPGTPGYAMPSDGAITEFSHLNEAGENSSLSMAIYRRVADLTFLVVAKTVSQPTVANRLNSFPVSPPIQVKAGDLLGMSESSGTSVSFATGNPADVWVSRTGNVAPGGQVTLDESMFSSNRVDIAATFDPEETISSALATPRKFAVVKNGPAETPVSASAVAQGTTFRFNLSDVATVTYSIQRKFRGELKNGVCKKKKKPKKSKCTGLAPVGAFTAPGGAGANSRPFSGRIGKKALAPGKYQAVLTARDTAGNVSEPATIEFKVVKPKPQPR